MKNINKITSKDLLYTSIKATIGSVPIIGSAASEFFGLLLTSPLEKRRQTWMEEVANKLIELQDKGQFNINELTKNDQFIDVILQATNLAIKNSEDEKLDALKNAVINTASIECPDKIKTHIFLNMIDQFTVWHIKILKLYDDPKNWFDSNEQTLPNLMMGSLSSVLKSAYPEMAQEGELIKLIWQDLHDAGMHNSTEMNTMMSGDSIFSSRTTKLGKEFLKYISE